MKRVILSFLLALCLITNSYSQSAEVKVNIAAGALTIFNPSIELNVGSQSGITFDYIGAYAREDFLNTGSPFLLSMALFGYRHYFKADSYDGWFIGGEFGLDQFRMDKNITPLVVNDNQEGKYDVGYGYVIGGTFGYKYRLSNRLGIEANVSYGFHHAQHEGYVDGVKIFDLNASAEWVPYKAGIYINYKLWK